MAKPLHEFGGWLRFFQFIMFANLLVMGIIALIAIVASMMASEPNAVFYMASEALQFAVLGYFMFAILKLLGGRSRDIPERIIKMLQYYMLFSIGYLAIEVPLTLWMNGGSWHSKDSQSVRSSLSTIFQYLIWKSYFTKSIRVKNVYCLDIIARNLEERTQDGSAVAQRADLDI